MNNIQMKLIHGDTVIILIKNVICLTTLKHTYIFRGYCTVSRICKLDSYQDEQRSPMSKTEEK